MLDGGEEKSEAGDYLLFLILIADPYWQKVTLPLIEGRCRHRIIDTGLPEGEDFLDAGKEIKLTPQDHYLANGRTTVLLLCR